MYETGIYRRAGHLAQKHTFSRVFGYFSREDDFLTGQTLNSYYKSHIVNIIDTILSWQLQCKHLVYIILY